jgi:hypothetical protein
MRASEMNSTIGKDHVSGEVVLDRVANRDGSAPAHAGPRMLDVHISAAE